ncbi:TetR/AcrR family transcriptional regulator [Phaeodactylibacter sp.]|uniref:TetR/AcrR family transcriptional regulator n=1 Tax=Phaeodactylibacter sp. TaxID=1940289 RepID=UPI0025F02821|nr:TetR/AcrR family transcriptional regulator [Phaeodactylibacter sp.]MCI4647909.1 TetR/AcrR family transcriptional regulator [Phaeodactylibacter sp.]MCI5092398.1 TetR/AcrR family transcriptional regulator [Phaeodactylibacter sp.]
MPKTTTEAAALQLAWLQHGYAIFAHHGPEALKVEGLARAVGKSKSSFYHHFADPEGFQESLLHHHLEQARLIAKKEAACQSLDDLVEVLLEHKTDLLFNRQLRVHRSHPAFERCFDATTELTVPAILPVWKKIIGLEDQSYLAGLVLQLSLENFYIQLTPDTLNRAWLLDYFAGLQHLVRSFQAQKTKV